MRREVSKTAFRLLLVWLFIISIFCISCSRSRHYPHVIIITIDGLSPDHLSCFGNKNLKTPNIDGIAAKGVRFEEAITPSPLTLPGHASLFTGLLPEKHGVRCDGMMMLESKYQTLAEMLRDNGYETAAVAGSSMLHHRFGLDQGFEDYYNDLSEGLYFDGGEIKLKGKDVTLHSIKRFYARFRQKPLFLWVNYADLSLIRNDQLDAMLLYIDANSGKLIEEIPSGRPALVVITSAYAVEPGPAAMIETGYALDLDAIRVPMVISGHGLPQGKVVQGQAGIIDIYPTLLDLIGIKSTADFDGKSLLKEIEAGRVDPAALNVETLEPYCKMGWPGLRGTIEEKKLSIQVAGEIFPDAHQALRIVNLLAEAEVKSFHKDFDDAEKDIKKVLEQDPDNLRALLGLGWIFLKTGKIPEAKKLFLHAGEIREDDPRVITGVAASSLKENDLQASEALFSEVDETSAPPREYYFYYGMLLNEKSEFDRAARMLELAVSIDPLDKESQLLLGQALVSRDKVKEGLKHLELAIALDSDYLEAYRELERVHSQLLKNEIKARAYRQKIDSLMKKKELPK